MNLLSERVFLDIAVLLTSILSGTIGMGGGILLVAVMAPHMPPATLIPIHGIIQLFSNASRTLLSRRAIVWPLTWQFATGTIFGAWLGSHVLFQLPTRWYQLALALLILLLTFVPPPTIVARFPLKWPVVGFLNTFLSMFMGATGPFVAPFYLHENLEKESLVVTKSACQTCTHFAKLAAFVMGGFALSEYVPLMVEIFIIVLIGNYIGKLLLHRISEKWFTLLFKGAIIVLCLQMIVKGLWPAT